MPTCDEWCRNGEKKSWFPFTLQPGLSEGTWAVKAELREEMAGACLLKSLQFLTVTMWMAISPPGTESPMGSKGLFCPEAEALNSGLFSSLRSRTRLRNGGGSVKVCVSVFVYVFVCECVSV